MTVLEEFPYKTEVLNWLNSLQILIQEHFLVLDSAKQVGLLVGVFLVGLLLKGKLVRLTESIRLPSSLVNKYPGFAASFHTGVKESLTPIAVPLFLILVLWFCVFAMRSIDAGFYILNLVVSLLNAWVVIRFASTFIKDPGWSKFVSILAWSIAALSIVGLLDVTTAFLDNLAFSFGEMHFSVLKLIKGVIAIAIMFWLFQLLEKVAKRRIDGFGNITPSAKVLLKKFLRVVLIILAVLIALDAMGIDLTALAVFSGAIGIGLGFGLQKVAANLVSGVILLLDRSVKPGDVIALGETYGKIDKLGGRYVSVITRDGTEHLIPNEELITQRVENWSFSDTNVRQRCMIGIDYTSDVRLAMSLCEEAAGDTARIVKTPAPRCLLRDFADSSVNIELRFWVSDAQNGLGNVRSDVMLRIWDKFHENGVLFTYPHRDLHIKDPISVRLETDEEKSDV